MHGVPSVRYPVERSQRAAWCLGGAWALGALAVVGWIVSAPLRPVWPQAVGAVLVALGGLAVHAAWRRTVAGTLGWDGQHWRWEPSTGMQRLPEGALRLSLDLQSLMLVAFRPAGQSAVWLWLWLDRDAVPTAWHSLRCAVHGRPVGNRLGAPAQDTP